MPVNHTFLYSAALEYAIDRYPPIVPPDTSLEDILTLMSQLRSSCPLPVSNSTTDPKTAPSVRASCLLILEGATPVSEQLQTLCETGQPSAVPTEISPRNIGIFTERDIVRMTAEEIDLKQVKVGEVMTFPVTSLTQTNSEDIFTALSLFRQHRIRHLPLFNQEGELLGIVTPESIRQALQPVNLFTKLRYVKDVMASQVVHAPETARVLDLAQIMARERVSCVVICQQGDRENSATSNPTIPVGIVTERDIVQFQALQLEMAKLQAKDVMSAPLFCLSPEDSLWFAHQEMQRLHVRRLVVSGTSGELLGIVSQTSLLHALGPTEMYGLIEGLQQVVEDRTQELEQANQQLRHEIEERKKAETALQAAHDNLQELVEERTAALKATNEQLKRDIQERQRVEAALRESESQLRQQARELEAAIAELQQTQFQLIQAEKMSGLGQLVAGVAHEINNPVNFIYGNLSHANQYIKDLLELIDLYEEHYPEPVPDIQDFIEDRDLEFLVSDLPKLLASMQVGAERIRNIVLSLRNFSRLDEAQMKRVDIHEGLDSTLLILQHRLKEVSGTSEIDIIKEYGDLPRVDCYVGPLNQVFMNILSNAIDALESVIGSNDKPQMTHDQGQKTIRISTDRLGSDRIVIRIADNGPGMSETLRRRIFEPFFTTKPVGSGTGLGLSISYQIIVEKHGGRLECISAPSRGCEFIIEIPVQQSQHNQSLFSSSQFKSKRKNRKN
ncbi:CBS domain-containing protein [Phormidium sp. CCY1219]|uniref:CBS domain-containing protein n=1 Tax=Phormidium sp. CCY1219 TaxID=2886104 RepID=UPI002D1EA88A|nr:CBS domain-containing protein [Phormidium sp. CCY1219]MEB3827132.1 CBS domain-containing protein [Phormidium sp. CCY1219]